MSKSLLLNPEYDLYSKNNRPMCSSLQVAKTFGKEHFHVLRDIEALDCSNEFRQSNFGLSSYRNQQNKKQPMVMMTKDGFTFLVMGYRGKRAAGYKEWYIGRFNAMESHLATRQAAKLEYPALTDAIKESHDSPQSYHYSNENDMINQIVTGKRARDLRAEYGLTKGENIRDYLSAFEIAAIVELQRVSVGLHAAGMEYQQRKEIMTAHYHNKIVRRLAA